MPDFWAYTHSIWHIILIGCGSLLGAGWITFQGLSRFKISNLRAFHECEAGAAYSLAYVMTVPIYLMFVCLVIECTLIFITKIGSVHAAYAACRSNVVYHALDKFEFTTTERSRRGAVRAMVPFASSFPRNLDTVPSSDVVRDAIDYVAAVSRFIKDRPIGEEYLRKKYYYANQATSITVSKRKPGVENWNAPVTVSLSYEAPLLIPGVTRFLGRRSPRSGKFFFTEFETIVSIPDERPQSPDGKMGVNYPSRD